MPLSRALAFFSLSPSGTAASPPAAGSLALCSGVACSAGSEHDDRPAPTINASAAADSRGPRILLFMWEILFFQVRKIAERMSTGNVGGRIDSSGKTSHLGEADYRVKYPIGNRGGWQTPEGLPAHDLEQPPLDRGQHAGQFVTALEHLAVFAEQRPHALAATQRRAFLEPHLRNFGGAAE